MSRNKSGNGVEKTRIRAVLLLRGWFAHTARLACVIVGETPKRYRIENSNKEPMQIAGRRRYLAPGATALVPKHAVEIVRPRSEPKPQLEYLP